MFVTISRHKKKDRVFGIKCTGVRNDKTQIKNWKNMVFGMKVVQKIVTNIDSCVFRDKNLKFDGSSEWKLPSPTPSSRSPETTLHIVVSIPFRIPGYIFPISLFFHYDFLSRIDYELLSKIFWDKKSFPNTWTHVGCSEKSGAKCPSPVALVELSNLVWYVI